MITPFSVNYSEDLMDDLRSRIRNTRWPDEITGSGWEYGANRSYMQQLAKYWATDFDWKKIEKEINSYPNFIAEIDGIKIHFLHIKGKALNSIPLIISHGWPGSFLEMMKIIPLLTEDKNFAFDLVIPSLIGYGFSDKFTSPGCNSLFIAELWTKLMTKLGYERFGAQGGDIGSRVSTWLAMKFPERLLGLHLNMIPGSYQPYLKPGEQFSEEGLAFQENAKQWREREGAYSHIHITKPITAAYGLNDSPLGLCAWIIEKFEAWSDNDNDLEKVFSKDELLANVTLYWLTETIHSSMRIYHENSFQPLIFGENDFVKVPTSFARFPKELLVPPRAYVEKGFNIRRWTEMPAGGHFAAMEQPQLLADDIKAFFSRLN